MLNSKETKIWCEIYKKWESYYVIIFIDWDDFENYSSIVLQTFHYIADLFGIQIRFSCRLWTLV